MFQVISFVFFNIGSIHTPIDLCSILLCITINNNDENRALEALAMSGAQEMEEMGQLLFESDLVEVILNQKRLKDRIPCSSTSKSQATSKHTNRTCMPLATAHMPQILLTLFEDTA